MAKRRIGIVGAGFGAEVHAPAFASEGWTVAAICSRDRGRAERAAAALGVVDVHTDPMELIGRDDLDAVSIATPPRAHRALVLAALAQGRHVLCEKPFAMNAEEAAEMNAAASASGLTAMVAHEFRYASQRSEIRRLVQQGYVGRFRLCTIELFLDRQGHARPDRRLWNLLESEGGGALGGVGSHYADALVHWFGAVASVSGWTDTFRRDLDDPHRGGQVRSETDDSFGFTLFFADGGIATVTASLAVHPGRGTVIAVMGDEGTLLATQPGPIPLPRGLVMGSRRGEAFKEMPFPDDPESVVDDRDPRLTAFRMLVRDFNEGIAEGTSRSPNFADGLHCQGILDAVRSAAAADWRVPLAHPL